MKKPPALTTVDENGKSKGERFDCYFFYHWVNNVPYPVRNEFQDKLKSIGFNTRGAWKKVAEKGTPKDGFAQKAFEVSARLSQVTKKRYLWGYIKFAREQGASLYGIKGHEDAVDALLEGVTIDSCPEPQTQTAGKHRDGLSICRENDILKIEEKPGEKYLRILNQSDNLSLDNVATLLEWQYHLTPFMGREREIAQLQRWLDSPPDRSIQLIYGEGGVGKTRLAFHFAEEILEQGWQAGQTDLDIVGDWYVGRMGLLIIIDYPEHREHFVTQLVRAVKNMPEMRKKVRVLLLSRNRDYLQTLTTEAPGLVNTPIHLLGLRTKDEQWNLMNAAWDRLQDLKIHLTHQKSSEIQKSPLPIEKTTLTAWLKQQSLQSTPLMIIALAVYFLEQGDQVKDPLMGLKDQDVIRHLSKREERRIRNEVEQFRKTHDINNDFEPECVLLIKAMAAITDGLDDRAIRLLNSELKPQQLDYPPQKVKHLKKLSLWLNKQLPALKPDILAADFLSYCLERWAENQESEWLFAVIGLSRTRVNIKVDDQQLLENFSRLGRLIFDAKVKLKQPWPIDALCLSIQDNPTHSAWIATHLTKTDLEPHLRPLVICALRACLKQTLVPPIQAHHLHNLSLNLSKTGDTAGALEAIQRAVNIWEVLAKENFSVFGPDLAKSLDMLCLDLSKTGDKAGALKAIQRAVNIWEKLPKENVSFYFSDFGISLHNLSNLLSETGDKAGALEAIQRAVNISQYFAKKNFDTHARGLAIELYNLCNRLSETGDKNEALLAIQRAVKIWEVLAEENFPVFGPSLATSLSSLSNQLLETVDKAGALEISKRAVALFDSLADENFTAYGLDLGISLRGLHLALLKTGDKIGALKAIRRSVKILEANAEENYPVYRLHWAISLEYFSKHLFEAGEKAGALHVTGGAVSIFNALAQENFTLYGLDLAIGLGNLSFLLSETGNHEEGGHAFGRAIKIREDLAEENFSVYGPSLGYTLLNYCIHSEFHVPSIIRTKEIYLQLRDTCHDPWVHDFPATLNKLLTRANKDHDKDAAKTIESIIDEINSTSPS
ncbi:MAG: tetratricopeptide repeat protein [Pseudomonadota bacterium]